MFATQYHVLARFEDGEFTVTGWGTLLVLTFLFAILYAGSLNRKGK